MTKLLGFPGEGSTSIDSKFPCPLRTQNHGATSEGGAPEGGRGARESGSWNFTLLVLLHLCADKYIEEKTCCILIILY